MIPHLAVKVLDYKGIGNKQQENMSITIRSPHPKLHKQREREREREREGDMLKTCKFACAISEDKHKSHQSIRCSSIQN